MDDTQNTKQTAEEDWPNTVRSREELDAALEQGEKSGESTRTAEEVFEAAIFRLKNG